MPSLAVEITRKHRLRLFVRPTGTHNCWFADALIIRETTLARGGGQLENAIGLLIFGRYSGGVQHFSVRASCGWQG